MSRHVAGQAETAGVVAGGQVDRRAFRLGNHWLQPEEPLQHGGAFAVDVSGSGADLGVAIACQRFLEKVDQTSFALQRGQQRHGLAAELFLRRGGLRRSRFLRLRRLPGPRRRAALEQIVNLARHRAVKQGEEENPQGVQYASHQENPLLC